MDPTARLLAGDRAHVWHPYDSATDPLPVLPVASASGVRLRLTDGRELVDGMASWWAAVHGYRHPVLDAAVRDQLGAMAHVMLGGLTHAPAVALAERLVELTPGAAAAGVLLRLRVGGGRGRDEDGRAVLGRRRGDPRRPGCSRCAAATTATRCGRCPCATRTRACTGSSRVCPSSCSPLGRSAASTRSSSRRTPHELEKLLAEHADEVAAVVLEPVVQGAGGMWFYSPAYLRRVRELCDTYDVLLVADEIATGFGRTGTLFACEQAGDRARPDVRGQGADRRLRLDGRDVVHRRGRGCRVDEAATSAGVLHARADVHGQPAGRGGVAGVASTCCSAAGGPPTSRGCRRRLRDGPRAGAGAAGRGRRPRARRDRRASRCATRWTCAPPTRSWPSAGCGCGRSAGCSTRCRAYVMADEDVDRVTAAMVELAAAAPAPEA